MSKINNPKFRVILGDETEHIVQTIQADSVTWDQTRHKHNWPPLSKDGSGAFLWSTFLAWHALKRTGKAAETWEQFSTTVIEVEHIGDSTVDPTPQDHTPG